MRVYIDCEFNGFGGELISMALVTDDGREWYEVLGLPNDVNPWVAEHVVPILGKEPVSSEYFRSSLHNFLGGISDPVIIADWYTDLVHFLQLFAGKDHSESLSYPCMLRIVDSNLINYPEPEMQHNALYDARALRTAVQGGIYSVRHAG